MSFLRKWGSSAGQENGQGGAVEPKLEWHSETAGERYFGMENFGNTCYANSVLQSLYFSKPFRELVENYLGAPPQPTSPTVSISSTLSSQPLSASASNRRPKSAGQPSPSLSSANSIRRAPTRPATSAGRSTIANAFGGHKRQDSTSTAGTSPPDGATGASPAGKEDDASTDGGKSELGAPLAAVSSFTGVGTPVLNNDTLLSEAPAKDSTLLTTLHDLFRVISAQPKTTGTVAPQAFINQLKRDNEFFRSTLHQDAHEFLNYLVNMIAEAVEKEDKLRYGEDRLPRSEVQRTWVHRLFAGILTNETRCLTCETVTSREEAFFDLSIDIEPNSSITSCLRQFSASEMLCQRNKFSCDKCCGLQEAEKRMMIKKLPNLLALHLKRFKYEESLQRHVKLTYRVVFPFELRFPDTSDDASDPDRLYELWAIVVHIGAGPHHGHYITIVKSGHRWVVFDDNQVYPIESSDIQKYYGDTPGQGSGYVLFYQAVDIDFKSLGLVTRKERSRSTTSSSAASTGAISNMFANDHIPPVPPLPTSPGLGLHLNGVHPVVVPAYEFPASPPVDAAHSLFPHPTAIEPESEVATPTNSALPTTTPKSEKSAYLASNVGSGSPLLKEKEGGWGLKGKKSMTSRIGRSLSLASNKDKETVRAVSSPILSTPMDPVPSMTTSVSNGHLANVNGNPLEHLFTATPQTQSPATSSPASTPAVEPESTPPLTSRAPSVSPKLTSAFVPPPPSDDGSASTVSTNQLGPGYTPQRRGSKASSEGAGMFAATGNFLTRKARPISIVSPSSQTASPALNGNSFPPVRPDTNLGASLASAPSASGTMSKKELEKKMKEDRKAREKEEERKAKERKAKEKEDQKRRKEEEKLEKARKKMSVRA